MHKGSQDLNNRKGIIAFQAELRKELKDGDGHAFGQKASIYKQTIQDIDSVSSDTNFEVYSVFLRKCNINLCSLKFETSNLLTAFSWASSKLITHHKPIPYLA